MIIIEKQITAENGAVVSHHFVRKAEISPDGDAVVLQIESWPNEQSRLEMRDPIARMAARIPLSLVGTGLIDSMKTVLTSEGPFLGAVALSVSPTRTLQELKLLKNAEINSARFAANQSWFTFAGKQIACDPLSRSDIEGVNGIVANTGSLPAGFPGAWKAIDNSYVVIADAAQWTQFYAAMVAKGLANFAHAQALKAELAAAETAEAISSISWGAGPQ